MLLMIASDIHGSSKYCSELMKAKEIEKPDKLILLGDLLYHGPRNSLPDEYNPKEVLGMLNGIKNELVCVRGNCDSEVDQMVLDFPMMAEYSVLLFEKSTFWMTHGHRIPDKLQSSICRGDVILCGHTHVPACEVTEYGAVKVNPGSVSIPKENSERGYIITDGENIIWKTLGGEIYRKESVSALINAVR